VHTGKKRERESINATTQSPTLSLLDELVS
jgi:hypothetical protein